jgi:hypothetical protein
MTRGAEASPALDSESLPDLVAELANKSDLVWVGVPGRPPQALWSIWHSGSLAVVVGGIEQPDPGLVDGSPVEVILRSKENRARQLSVRAVASRLEPGTEAWEATAAALHPKRLNPPDGDEQPERWARESALWLMRPTDDVTEQPGAMSDDSHRATVVVTEATTRTRTPYHAGKATKRRRKR